MRADRLVSVLLVLQRRGQVTVAEIAKELEISPRTARRDLEALGMAGLPVYSVPGRGGGWRLLGEGRTDLSGLSSAEAVALFARLGMVGGTPQPEMAGALRKLSRALPATFRETAERAASSIRTTEAPRGGPAPELDAPVDERMLSLVRDSVVRARRAEMVYTAREGALSTRLVEPLGLVARGARWYLIATTDRGQRTFRLDRIEGYRMLDEPATRPADFDLDAVGPRSPRGWTTCAGRFGPQCGWRLGHCPASRPSWASDCWWRTPRVRRRWAVSFVGGVSPSWRRNWPDSIRGCGFWGLPNCASPSPISGTLSSRSTVWKKASGQRDRGRVPRSNPIPATTIKSPTATKGHGDHISVQLTVIGVVSQCSPGPKRFSQAMCSGTTPTPLSIQKAAGPRNLGTRTPIKVHRAARGSR